MKNAIAENVFKVYRNLTVRPHAKLIERGVLVEQDGYVIAYQVCFNRVPKEDKELFGVEDAYDIDFVFYDKATEYTVDLNALYEVVVDKKIIPELLEEIRNSWRTKVSDHAYYKIERYKEGGQVVTKNIRNIIKKDLLSLEFLLRNYFPGIYATAPADLFNRE